MINIYDFICSNSSAFDQLQFGNNGDVFIDYLCPIQELKARAWSHKNCMMYVVQGTKGYNTVTHFHRSHGFIMHQTPRLFS